MNNNTTTTKQAILTMGLPGAGKSYTVSRTFDTSQFVMVDPDAIKALHPDYNPKAPELLHEWSKQQANAMQAQAVADGRNLIIDGTGTNAEKMVKWTLELQAAGYTVTAFYVAVTVATSLKRNAKRERNVPEAVIREKAELMATSVEIVSRYTDATTVINND
jgi:predicted kinase